MTIKKLSLSAVAAAMVATSAIAGSIDAGSLSKVSKELLTAQAVDVNLSNGIEYTNSMNNTDVKTASEAGFELEIAGLKNASGLEVINPDTNTTIATQTGIVGDTIIFEAATGQSAVEDQTYMFISTSTKGVSNDIVAGELEVSIPKGSTSLSATVKTTSNDGVSVLDTASGPIVSTVQQFSLQVSEKLSASIDAAADFLEFTTVNGLAATTTTDTFEYNFTNLKAELDFPADETARSMVLLTGDQNISTYAVTSSVGADTVNDMNITLDTGADLALDTNGTTSTVTRTFTVNPTDDMRPVTFTLNGTTTINGGVVVNLGTGLDAGNWDVYGYTAQIPNVAGLSTHDTVMKFTNRSSIDADIYFTLIDPDGTVARLNSVDNPELASLAADTTGTYVASALLALVDDAAFNKTGSISVEVAVPTTPDAVYGMASFKNNALGQFKDLPVYNSSDMNY